MRVRAHQGGGGAAEARIDLFPQPVGGTALAAAVQRGAEAMQVATDAERRLLYGERQYSSPRRPEQHSDANCLRRAVAACLHRGVGVGEARRIHGGRQNLSQLSFIEASTAQLVKDGNISCPICFLDIQPPFSVLPCGHAFCVECLELSCKHAEQHRVSCYCPVCSRPFVREDVMHGGSIHE